MLKLNKLSLLVSIFGLSFFAPSAYAQSCGGGFAQEGGSGIISCVPLYSPSNQDAPIPQGPVWVSRWGAIAFDPIQGKFGGAEGHESKNKAFKAAIKECERNGGKKCKIIGNHTNQCGALASGVNYTVAWGGPDKQKTIDDAINACSQKTTNCQAYYAGCSYAARYK